MRNKTFFNRIFFIFLFCFVGLSAWAESFTEKYDQVLAICERYYEDGDYERALANCSDLIRQLKAKKTDHAAIVKLGMYQAKYYEAMGNYAKFEETLARNLKDKRELRGETSTVYGLGLLEAAVLYSEFGSSNKAEEYLKQAEGVLGVSMSEEGKLSKNLKDDGIEANLLLVKAKVAYQRGDIQIFSKVIDRLIKVRKNRIRGTDSEYFDEVTNNYTSRELDAIEQKRRKTEAAEAQTLKGDGLRQAGRYKEADEVLQTNEAWIKEFLNPREIAFIRNQFSRLSLAFDKGEDSTTIRKKFEANIYLAERALTPVHKVYSQLHQNLIDYYIDYKYLGKSALQRWEFEQNTGLYFGEKTPQYALAKLFDIDAGVSEKSVKSENTKEGSQKKIKEWYDDYIKILPQTHPARIHWLKLIYTVSLGFDEYELGQDYLNELLRSIESIKGKESLDYYYAQMEQAEYWTTYTNRFDEANTLIQKTFYGGIMQKISAEHKAYLPFLNQLAIHYEMTEAYDSAGIKISEAVSIAEATYGTNHPIYATEYTNLLQFYMTRGEYKGLDSSFVRILKIFDNNKNRGVWALQHSQSLQVAAGYYAIMGLFDEAKRDLLKAQTLYKKTSGAISNSTAIDELAYLLIKTEQFEDAEKLLNEAIKTRISRYGEDSRFLVNPYNQLASLNMNFYGEYGKAEEYITKSLEISRKSFGEKSLKNVEGMSILSELYAAMGDYEKAKQEIEQVIALEEAYFGEDHIEVANSLTQLAQIKFEKGDKLTEVEELFTKAENIVASSLGKQTPVYAKEAKNLAAVYTESNKLDKALEKLGEANDIWLKVLGTERNSNTAEINMLIADVEVRRKNYAVAFEKYTACLKIYKKLFNENHPKYLKVLSRIARMYYAQGELEQSKKYIDEVLGKHKKYITDFFVALSDKEKAQFFALIKVDFDFFTNLAVRMSPKNPAVMGEVYNNTLLTKSLLLNSAIRKIKKEITSSQDTVLQRIYTTWQTSKERLIQALALSADQQKDAGIDVKQIQKLIEDSEKQLSRRSKTFAQSAKAGEITWQQIQTVLKMNEHATEIIKYRYFNQNFTDSVIYAALLIKKASKAPQFIAFAEGKKMEGAYFSTHRNHIKFDVNEKSDYERYWKALDQELPPNAKLYLSTSGIYNQLNIESMYKTNKKYVIDEMDINLVGSTQDLLDRQGSSGLQGGDVFLVGNPAFYKDQKTKEELLTSKTTRQVSQLPGTQREIELIDSLLRRNNLNVNTYLNFEAEENRLDFKKSPTVFHIATHGFFEPDLSEGSDNAVGGTKAVNNPLLRSGVLLRNAGNMVATGNVYKYNQEPGILTAYEAMDLNLEGTELVILSACETGRGGAGDGVAGLQRAFLVAGARSVVMSLFKVDDEATQKLMELFYQNWYKSNDKRTAFAAAKKQLREIPRFAQPRFWSPFIMVGSE